jgi:hypothetical protein
LGIIIALLVVVGIPAYFLLYNPPSCTDGIQNQNELGVDCGGSCSKICAASYISPQIEWARADQIGEGLYNLGAYVKNVNLLGATKRAPYVFSVFDREGHLIAERKGESFIPPRKNFVVFERAVNTQQSIPYIVRFEFEGQLQWEKAIPTDESLVISEKQFWSDESGYYLQAAVENRSLFPTGSLRVQGVLYDADGKVVGFSQTTVDVIQKSSKEYVVFTWRKYGERNVASSEVIPITAPRFE